MFKIHFEQPESILSSLRLQGQTGRPGPLEAPGPKPASFALTFNSGGPFLGRSGSTAKTAVLGLWRIWGPSWPVLLLLLIAADHSEAAPAQVPKRPSNSKQFLKVQLEEEYFQIPFLKIFLAFQNQTYKVLLKGCPGHAMVMGSQLAMFEIHFE